MSASNVHSVDPVRPAALHVAATCRFVGKTLALSWFGLFIATVAVLCSAPWMADSIAALGLFGMALSLGVVCLPAAVLLLLVSSLLRVLLHQPRSERDHPAPAP